MENGERALLPPGMNDLLPPDAAHEAATVESLIAAFAAQGYDRVKPPMLEFEETLLGGAGASMVGQTFRLMDPVSHRMLALRADMTLQIARIATSRLGHAPRPLRLCYSGQVLQVSGSQLRPQRQVGQAGCELIGAPGAAADAEIVALAAQALTDVGVQGLSVDLNLPTLVPAICQALGVADSENGAQMAKLRAALDRKDAAGVAAQGGPAASLLGALLAAAGPAQKTLATLKGLDLPPAAGREVARLAEVVGLIAAALPDLKLTVDPVENRGFEYHCGVSFVLFALNMRGELGRGGRYMAGVNGSLEKDKGEPSTGFTLFMDTVLQAMPGPQPDKKLYLPHGAAPAEGRRLRAEGWTTVAGLAPAGDADAKAEARRLGCSHVLIAGKPALIG
ncbi:MAG TPA: ATP phosphoribosyltransferase regulatory subunit [Alphaproteobacteria bacterium]|jgi:ATP phosphoribosyltransferase regulatory subunit